MAQLQSTDITGSLKVTGFANFINSASVTGSLQVLGIISGNLTLPSGLVSSSLDSLDSLNIYKVQTFGGF